MQSVKRNFTLRYFLIFLPVLLVSVGCVTKSSISVSDMSESTIVHPETWDERVASLVEFVEEEKGKQFQHPVEIAFLTEDEFLEEVSTDESELDEEDQQSLLDTEGLLRSFGLVDGEFSLIEEADDIGAATILAFYSPEEDKIFIRGTELDVSGRVTVVHELTHAWQDQWYDLDPISDVDSEALNDASNVFHALAEGDATLVEYAYVDSLSKSDTQAYEDTQSTQGEEVQEDISGYSEFLVALQSAPYALGESFLTIIRQENGKGAINDIFADPPVYESQLLEPWRYLAKETYTDGEDVVVEIEEKDGIDAEISDDTTMGALTWYLLLAEQIDPGKALQAVDGISGDHLIIYRRGDLVCSKARFSGATQADDEEMYQALKSWSANIGESWITYEENEIRKIDEGVDFTSCDPGKDNTYTPIGRSSEALELVAGRLQALAGLLEEPGVSMDELGCAFTSAFSGLTWKDFDNEGAGIERKVSRGMIAAMNECGIELSDTSDITDTPI